MNAFCCDKALRKKEHEPGFAGCAVICLTFFNHDGSKDSGKGKMS
jgi:hypothetical protein